MRRYRQVMRMKFFLQSVAAAAVCVWGGFVIGCSNPGPHQVGELLPFSIVGASFMLAVEFAARVIYPNTPKD